MRTLTNTLNLYTDNGTRKYTELYATMVETGTIKDQYGMYHFTNNTKIKQGDWFSCVYTGKKLMSANKMRVQLKEFIDFVIDK